MGQVIFRVFVEKSNNYIALQSKVSKGSSMGMKVKKTFYHQVIETFYHQVIQTFYHQAPGHWNILLPGH